MFLKARENFYFHLHMFYSHPLDGRQIHAAAAIAQCGLCLAGEWKFKVNTYGNCEDPSIFLGLHGRIAFQRGSANLSLLSQKFHTTKISFTRRSVQSKADFEVFETVRASSQTPFLSFFFFCNVFLIITTSIYIYDQ